jgi:aspartate 1-decarboxylase
LIVIAYGMLPLEEAKNHTPVAVYVDENNQQVKH